MKPFTWLGAVGMSLTLSAGACESTAARCSRVALEALQAANYQLALEAIAQYSADAESMYRAQHNDQLPDSARRRIEHWARSRYLQDVGGIRADGRPDTAAPERHIPPRPSDAAWHAEHCDGGRAR